MLFKVIQAILIPEFTIIITVLGKPRISNGEGALKIEPRIFSKIRQNYIRVFTRGSCVENVNNIEAF